MRHTETWDKPSYLCWSIQNNLHHEVVTAHVGLYFYTTPNSWQVKHQVSSSFGLTGIDILWGSFSTCGIVGFLALPLRVPVRTDWAGGARGCRLHCVVIGLALNCT